MRESLLFSTWLLFCLLHLSLAVHDLALQDNGVRVLYNGMKWWQVRFLGGLAAYGSRLNTPNGLKIARKTNCPLSIDYLPIKNGNCHSCVKLGYICNWYIYICIHMCYRIPLFFFSSFGLLISFPPMPMFTLRCTIWSQLQVFLSSRRGCAAGSNCSLPKISPPVTFDWWVSETRYDHCMCIYDLLYNWMNLFDMCM